MSIIINGVKIPEDAGYITSGTNNVVRSYVIDSLKLRGEVQAGKLYQIVHNNVYYCYVFADGGGIYLWKL